MTAVLLGVGMQLVTFQRHETGRWIIQDTHSHAKNVGTVVFNGSNALRGNDEGCVSHYQLTI